ncbi:hypothetical protein NLC29_01230 [Candidatus Aminicenantes bacterium AH-873-B07]|jgi:hypothetical protein|nr:hypothetical protein [Candidatus Aminicenantes bacterium AH-873-B07]
MRFLKRQFLIKSFISLIIFVMIFSFISSSRLEAGGDCEAALLECLTDIGGWISKLIVLHLAYCLNGYEFCKKYYEPYL